MNSIIINFKSYWNQAEDASFKNIIMVLIYNFQSIRTQKKFMTRFVWKQQ